MTNAVVGNKDLITGSLPPRRSMLDIIFSSSLYRSSLNIRVPKKLITTPVEALPGQSERADAFFQGHFQFSGHDAHLTNAEPWFAPKMPLYWHLELHRFNWLRDFSANGSDAAKRHARALVSSWLKNFSTYHSHIWDPEILARRLINWVRQSEFLLTENDGDFNYKFLKSLRQQFLHLSRYCKYFARQEDQLELYLALYLCAISFPDTGSQKKKFARQVNEQIDKTILADGCHISRNPARHLIVLADLIGLKNSLLKLGNDIPPALMGGIDRLAPIVRFFQHGDGKLALFNGSFIGEEGECDQLLAVSDAPGRAPHRCPKGGFERLKAARALLILESGEGGRSKKIQKHAGIGSFEFSYGRDRLVVNCGSHPDPTSHWSKALAATAAHSTLSIEDKNASFPVPVTDEQEDPVQVTSHSEDGNLWLDLINPGYKPSLGITHTRRIYLNANGQNLRGEDLVEAANISAGSLVFDIRFHLHPDLSVSKSMGGKTLLLRTPNGAGWQFISSLSDISLEESIYCSRPGEHRKSQQIILTGRLHGNDSLTVKWALNLLGEDEGVA